MHVPKVHAAVLAFALQSLATPAPVVSSVTPTLPSACPTAAVPVASAQANFHCNERGTLTSKTYLARFLSTSQDFVSCYDACLADSRCVAFSYNDGNNYCRTFGKTLNSKGFKQSSASTTTFWNLKGCFVIDPACTVTPTPTSTTPTVTSSPTSTGPPAIPTYVYDPGFESPVYDQSCYCDSSPIWTFGTNNREVSSFETKYNVRDDSDQAGHGEWLVHFAAYGDDPHSIKIYQALHGLSTTDSYTMSIDYYNTQTSVNECRLQMLLDSTIIVDEILDPQIDHTWITTTPVTFTPTSTDPVFTVSFGCVGTSQAYFVTLVDNVYFQKALSLPEK